MIGERILTTAITRRVFVALLLSAALASVPAVRADDGTLDILVTNDDGIGSTGLDVLAAALRAAGHRVTVVAPADQQSGTGAHVSLGQIGVERHAPDHWSVDGTPADAVLVGLQGILSDPPDLVVSGPNFGQNLGANIVNSGTVGAAMMAVQEDVPAVALSVGIDLAERHASPEPYPSTVAAFPRAAAFAVRLVELLVQRRRESGHLLPPGLMLNVNYPHAPGGEPAPVRVVPVGRFGGFRLQYPPVDETSAVRTAFAYDERGFSDPDSDTRAFQRGLVTVSVVDPPWETDRAYNSALRRWLAAALHGAAGDDGPPP